MQMQDEILKIMPKPPREIQLAHIITASKLEKNRDYVKKDSHALAEAGFQVQEVDIAGMTQAEVRLALKNTEVLYVQGGNTFYLLQQARASGFDKVAKELINRGVIYIGVSAGSYIACPTIEMATWEHQDRNRVGLEDFSAFNLVPFLVTVHYTPKYRQVLKAAIARAKYPVKILTDEQAILVRDGKVKLVGSGREKRL